MTNEATGTIKVINEAQQISDKFKKREFVLTIGDTYPQYVPMQFTQDKCELLNNYQVGDQVKVNYNLRGREHQGKYYCNIEAWRIESVSQGQASPVVNTNDNDNLPF